MPEQNQPGSAAQSHKKSQPKAKLAPIVRQTSAEIERAPLPAEPIGAEATSGREGLAALLWGAEGAFGGGSAENQVARLGDTRLLTVQRQALAAQIGRAQGNGHLQRVVASLKRENKEAALALPNHRQEPGKQAEQRLIQQRSGEGNRETGHPLAAPVAVIQCQPVGGRRRAGGGRRRAVQLVDYAFIMGGGDTFYRNATRYYQSNLPRAQVIANRRSLAAVFNYLLGLGRAVRVRNLYLVTHAHPDGTLSFGLRRRGRITYGQLRRAIQGQWLRRMSGRLRRVITRGTTIHIKGCRIGRAGRMLELVDRAFGGLGRVTAPRHEQLFVPRRRGGRRIYYEALGEYFIERRGSVRLNRASLLTAFTRKYPNVNRRTWRRRLRRVRRQVRTKEYTALRRTWVPTGRQMRNRRIVAASIRRWLRRPYIMRGGIRYRVSGLRNYRQQRRGQDYIRHIYTFNLRRGRAIVNWIPYRLDVPTNRRAQSDANPWKRAEVARWDQYAWQVRRIRRGGWLTVKVVGRITEYYIPGTRFNMRRRP